MMKSKPAIIAFEQKVTDAVEKFRDSNNLQWNVGEDIYHRFYSLRWFIVPLMPMAWNAEIRNPDLLGYLVLGNHPIPVYRSLKIAGNLAELVNLETQDAATIDASETEL